MSCLKASKIFFCVHVYTQHFYDVSQFVGNMILVPSTGVDVKNALGCYKLWETVLEAQGEQDVPGCLRYDNCHCSAPCSHLLFIQFVSISFKFPAVMKL